nr:MAP7 domain-containing protein 1-like [Aegilops tauschii subsp. strangulata]
MDQTVLAVKKKKEGASVPAGTQQPAAAAPPSAGKGGDGARASLARSSSRGPDDRPQEKATSIAKPAPEAPAPCQPVEVPNAQEPPASSSAATNPQALAMMLTHPTLTMPMSIDPSASPDALEYVFSVLTRLRDDLQGPDCRLVSGRLELASGWVRSDTSVRAALRQAVSASKEGERAAGLAAAARDAAQKEADAAKKRCRQLEAELEIMRAERAAEARARKAEEEKMKAREDAVDGRDAELEQSARAQAAECSRLEKVEKKVEAEKAQLEEKSREALRALYEKGLEKSLVADDEGPAQLLPLLVTTLEGVVNRTVPMVEGEARALSSSALTRVFSHLHLRDPNADLGVLLEPVDEERCEAAAEAVKGQVEALLKKFLAIDPAPPADGAADPVTRADDAGNGDAADGKALPDDGAQG